MRVLLIEERRRHRAIDRVDAQIGGLQHYTTDLGEEGIDLGKVYDYDIILLDLNLPDMSGFEVLRSLRVSKVKTPILILSGVPASRTRSEGLASAPMTT
jgi:two-component system, cell cycle response regulator CtrA